MTTAIRDSIPAERVTLRGPHGEVAVYGFQPDPSGHTLPDFMRPAPSEEELAAHEAALEVEFPHDLRQLYLRYNGFKCYPRGFRYEWKQRDRDALSIGPGLDSSEVRETRGGFNYTHPLGDGRSCLAKVRERIGIYIPNGHIPFARMDGYSELVMDVRPGAGYGSIKLMVLLGAEAVLQAGMEVPLADVAPSVTAFFENMYDIDQEIEDELESTGY